VSVNELTFGDPGT